MTLLAAIVANGVLSSVLLAGAGGPLARVNGEPVTADDVRREFTRRHGGHARFLAGAVEARKFLDVVIDQRLLVQEAYRLELEAQPDIAKATREFRERKMVERLIATEIDEKARPTPDEVKAAWESRTTEVYQVRQIVVDSAEKAESVRTRLAAGEDFEALAREVSIGRSRLFGGRLPTVGWGAMEPAWEEAVFALSPGESSPVIRSAEGWEVVRLESKKTVERPELAKASSRIEGILRKRALDRRQRELSELLWARYGARLGLPEEGLAAYEAVAASTPERALAAWEGGAVLARELAASVDPRTLAATPAARRSEVLAERLRKLVDERLALREAEARAYAEEPGVAAAVRAFQENLMQGALYDRFVLKDVAVSEEELRAYYEEHRAELVAPEKRRVAHVVTATAAEALAAKERLEAGEAFAEVAKAVSTDKASAATGGDLGWIAATDVPPEFRPVLSMKEGEVSAPLPSKFGHHLVTVLGIEPARPRAFEEARGDIQKTLLERGRREARAAWVRQLRAAAKVSVDEKRVKEFARQNAEAPVLEGPRGQQAPHPSH
jgi:parvulin-like peptidyl-prolyl isomerase